MSNTSSEHEISDDESVTSDQNNQTEHLRINVQNLLTVLNSMFPNALTNSNNEIIHDDTITDILLKKDLGVISSIFHFDYSAKTSLRDNTRFCKSIHQLITVIYNIYKNSIFMGDIVSDLYLNDNYIKPFENVNSMKYNDIIVFVEEIPTLSFETITNMITLMTKSTISYYYNSLNLIFLCLNMKDSEHNIYDINIKIVSVPYLFKINSKTKCPYELNQKIYLNITDKNLYYHTLDLHRFEHQKLALIKNNMFTEYVEFGKDTYGYFIDQLSEPLSNIVKNRQIKYVDSDKNHRRELELYLRYDFSTHTRQPLILNRINMYIQTNMILKYVFKGWIFGDSLKRIDFTKNSNCYICYNDYDDLNNVPNQNVDLFKIKYVCCKESEQGICVHCFVNTVKTCHRNLKSSFICPFCKKSNYFYNQKLCSLIDEEEENH